MTVRVVSPQSGTDMPFARDGGTANLAPLTAQQLVSSVMGGGSDGVSN
jgi:hypothetical protein